MNTAKLRWVFISLATPVMALAFLLPGNSQAWLPAKGEGVVSFVFQDQYFRFHVTPGARADVGPTRSRSILADVTYSLSDKVAVSVGIPWIATKYSGSRPHPLPDFSGPTPIDDRTWHATAQDFRFDVRYNVTRNLLGKGIVLTPFVGSIVPSHDYPYFAHSGFGRNLKELQIGAAFAKLFEGSNLLVQGRYGYSFAERVVDISSNRSSGSLEVGYFATPKLRLMGLGTGQLTHGGIDVPLTRALDVLSLEQFLHHDQIHRENPLSLGAGVSYSLTETLDVYGSWMRTVSQRNGHLMDRGLSVGLSWSFSTRREGGATAGAREQSLTRCVCEKAGL
jgi:hypothetical protein